MRFLYFCWFYSLYYLLFLYCRLDDHGWYPYVRLLSHTDKPKSSSICTTGTTSALAEISFPHQSLIHSTGQVGLLFVARGGLCSDIAFKNSNINNCVRYGSSKCFLFLFHDPFSFLSFLLFNHWNKSSSVTHSLDWSGGNSFRRVWRSMFRDYFSRTLT